MRKLDDVAVQVLEGFLFDKTHLRAGGFAFAALPERLIDAIRDPGVKDLTIASNNAGIDGEGLGKLVHTRQVDKNDQLLCRREQRV